MKRGFILATLVFLLASAFNSSDYFYQDGNCPKFPAKLKQEDIAVVTVGGGKTLNLRVRPGLNKKIITKIPAYSYVTIIAGPVCDGGYRWYEVGWEGEDGWSAEVGPDGEYNMIPNGSPMPNSSEQPTDQGIIIHPEYGSESCNYEPGLCPTGDCAPPIYLPYSDVSGTPTGVFIVVDCQFRRIVNEETKQALGIQPNSETFSAWELSLPVGPDVPDANTNLGEFCKFKAEHFASVEPVAGARQCRITTSAPTVQVEPNAENSQSDSDVEQPANIQANWFCENLQIFCNFEVSGGEFPRPPRQPFDDGLAGVQCTEYVQRIRLDALCWLERPANGNQWVTQLSTDEASYLGITHDNNPAVGDIAVWESGCSVIDNHVGIVVADYENRCTSGQVAVADANHNGDGKIYEGKNYTCYKVQSSCMEFVHKSTKSLNAATCTVTNTEINLYCDQFRGFRKLWCKITGK